MVFAWWASVAATAAAPGLGRPIAFTSARVAGSRAIRGFAFPGRGARVTVPPTTYPKPRRPKARKRSHDLSKPLANPIGLASGTPATEVARPGSATSWPIRAHGRGSASVASATRWERSGSIEKNSRRPNTSYQPRLPGRSVVAIASDYARAP